MDWFDLLAVQESSLPPEFKSFNTKTEAPMLWPVDVKRQLNGKDPEARKD